MGFVVAMARIIRTDSPRRQRPCRRPDITGASATSGACFGGDMWSCAGMVLRAIPWFKAGKIPGVLKAIDRTIDAIQRLPRTLHAR
ncbi:hypothetical protein [Streptomyces althioticus]|uniref:hypothetical protein n=1 Tax=Streptomyces althioticus TaxID=83380 RepID=UPI0036BD3049